MTNAELRCSCGQPATEAEGILLAAAPELLAALKELLEYADNGTPIRPGALVLDDARAAIARATGTEKGR